MTRLGHFIIDGGWPVLWQFIGWDTLTILGILGTVALCDIAKG